jgi:hypothetical protein
LLSAFNQDDQPVQRPASTDKQKPKTEIQNQPNKSKPPIPDGKRQKIGSERQTKNATQLKSYR